MTFTGKTKNLGVIGNPIAHSFSPSMQNAALQEAQLDYAYIAMPVKEQDLAAAVQGLKAFNFRGINVTIPHKQAIMEHLDEINEDARIIGAVNTVVNDEGHLTGYNTDVTGFIGALKDKGFMPEGKSAVMLGAGGAARAVVWGLVKEKVESLAIGVRNVPKVQPLVEYFKDYIDIKLYNWEDESFKEELKSADLLINTTPLGMVPNIDTMPPVDWECISADCFVYDIIYTPAETKFLRVARAKGCKTLNGEGMLVGQGAEAFRLWTGVEPNQQVMAEALRSMLAK